MHLEIISREMKNKILLTLMGFVLVSMAVTSCLKSDDDTIYYGVDTSVRAFSIDTIAGKKYRFSIDNLNSIIFNPDSLPYLSDTLMSHFLVDTFNVAGFLLHEDTLFVAPTYTDLTGAINGKGEMVFTVLAVDQATTRKFKLNVNIHQQDPDSLVWKQINNVPQGLANARMGNKVKAHALGNALHIYNYSDTKEIKVYSTLTDNPSNYSWDETNVIGLPATAQMNNMAEFNGKLYVATAEGDVYGSADGINWDKDEALSGNISTLLAGSSESLMGIGYQDGEKVFCYTDTDATFWTFGERVPETFPTENISYTWHTTPTGVQKVTLVGMPLTSNTELVPWFTFIGDGWAELNTDDMYCPPIENASIVYCTDNLYIFGSGLDKVYTSLSGLTWQEVSSKFLLPEEISGQPNYGMAMDADNFIWIIVSRDGANQIWRGRVNKLGFAHQ